MVVFCRNRHTYIHPWSNVTSVFWGKYPNINQPYVKEVDTLSRELNEDGSITIKRLITHKRGGAFWMRAVGFPDQVRAIEQITVDPHDKQFTMRTKNVTASSLFEVAEIIKYKDVGENKTEYTQEVAITSFMPILQSAAEEYTARNIESNMDRGLKTMEELCETFAKDGIEGIKSRYNGALRILKNLEEKFDDFVDKAGDEINEIVDLVDKKIDECVDKVKRDFKAEAAT